MGFRFTLAAVLRLREIEEQREERALTDLLRQISEAQQTSHVIQSRLRALVRERDTLLGLSRPARAMHEAEAERSRLQDALKIHEQQLIKLEEHRLQQMARYQHAHRGRKTLTDMRDAQRSAWQAGRLRRDQAMADDVFLSRWRRQ